MQVHVFMYGRVQRVGFRFYIWLKAKFLGINGWVKNQKNGSVEAVFESDKKNVDKMLLCCKKGSFLARVDKIKIKMEKSKGFKKFKIIDFWFFKSF